MDDLRTRVLRAGVWVLSGHAASQILRLGSNLIMTRLLVPEMFGTMVLANVFLVGLQLLSDLGLRQNIVQSKRGNDLEFLNTIWTLQILRGGIIWAIAIGIAVALYLLGRAERLPATSVYAEPLLPYIIAVLSINALINGFESTKLSMASRNLALGKITLIDLLSQVVSLISMVAWAFVDRSVWALVAGSLLSSTLRVILGNFLLPGERNRLHWNHTAFREIWSFGKWIFPTSVLGFLAANGDRLILGGLTDANTLGMYSIAFFMVSALKDVFVKLIANVAFPALSEVAREKPTMVKETYYKFRGPIDVGTLLIVGVLFSAGHLVVGFLYDDRYAFAGHILEIICIVFIELRYAVAGHCFVALGKPKFLLPIIGIQVMALYGLMPIAFSWYGIDGALWIAGGSTLFTLPMTIYLKIKIGLFDISRELRPLPWLLVGLALGWVVNQTINRI